MRGLRIATVVLLFAFVLGTVPARAGAAVGICLMTMRFDFSGTINNNSPPTTYIMTSSGTCQTSAGIGKSVVMNGSGVATSARCLTLLMSGAYVVNFFPDPAPSASNGEFNLIGTASVAEARLNGSNPTFVGVAILAGGGLLGCANGTNSLTFSMVLAFADP